MQTRRERYREATQQKGRVAVVGICNVTPDSFSDGGKFLTEDSAKRRIDTIFEEGGAAVCLGGESTRPGATRISTHEELSRIRGPLRHAARCGVLVVDTRNPEVAEEALAIGAHAINDVSNLADPKIASLVAKAEAALVLMHSRPAHDTMQGFGNVPENAYGDVVRDVVSEWQRAANVARKAGVEEGALVMDPGLGFAKSRAHSLSLLARLQEVVSLTKVPVCVGASRKSFLVPNGVAPEDRLAASLTAALWGASHGATMVRVHDVAKTAEALTMQASLREQAHA